MIFSPFRALPFLVTFLALACGGPGSDGPAVVETVSGVGSGVESSQPGVASLFPSHGHFLADIHSGPDGYVDSVPSADHAPGAHGYALAQVIPGTEESRGRGG